jgi:hypothetical protein
MYFFVMINFLKIPCPSNLKMDVKMSSESPSGVRPPKSKVNVKMSSIPALLQKD